MTEEDKRVAGTARLNVPGGAAVPDGKIAGFARRPPRTNDTNDLSATLRPNGRSGGVGRVLNLCEGGMLVQSSSDLRVADTTDFRLAGSDFRYRGLAAVVHRDDRTIGLRFVTWEGPVESSVCALVAERLRGPHLGSHDPGKAGTALPMVWDSRKHEHAAISELSMIIEASPEAATRRHQVLNVGERGMLIDGLALPVGAQISFALAGTDIDYIGSGRVAYRTDTTAGVVVDDWDGAPEALRALITSGETISGETELGARLADADITDWS